MREVSRWDRKTPLLHFFREPKLYARTFLNGDHDVRVTQLFGPAISVQDLIFVFFQVWPCRSDRNFHENTIPKGPPRNPKLFVTLL